MATGSYADQPAAPPTAYDQAVESQLRATQTQVKLVDIASGTLLLIIGALAFMLAVALIDHWVLALGFWTRLLALAVLIGGSGWWFAVRILPPILRQINPVFAAHTIEQAEPSLKNSLINFLLLRGQREKIHAVVYQAVGQRAASDLSHVPAENIVDHSQLLKIGYVLAALLVVGAIYKVVSPKDPFQSAARLVAPWADIDRPSRVDIEEVSPGDVTIFQGEHVDVSATVRGLRAGDEAHVLFSTLDGQVIDQQVTMRLDDAGLRHTVKIPGDDYGAQTSLQYKIIAGDAQTRWHNVQVVPAPHVLVTKVEYAPPSYTKREPFDDNRGDIDGVEGTLVTIHARANREIASAYVEFDPLPDGVTEEAKAASHSESVRIREIDGQNVQVNFYLRMSADRKSPWHQNYTIRFNTTDGYRNQQPVVHSIDVKPDLAPLVEILTPVTADVEVPLNRKVDIEVRAVDPDFALSKIRLVAIGDSRDLLDVALLESADGRSGQVIQKFEFAPESYGLKVGDTVEYWAIAEDNRRAVKSGSPEPNVTRSTPNYRIKIIAAESEAAEPPMDEKAEDMPRDDGAESDASSEGGPSDDASGGDSGGEGSDDKSENRPEESGNESGESGNSGGSGSESSEESSDGSETSEDAAGNSGGSSNSQGSKPDGTSNDQSGGGESSDGSSASQPSDSQPGDSQSGSKNQSGGSQSNGGNQQGEPSGDPLESDGSQDGDVFDRINEHRQQQEELRDKNLDSKQNGDTGNSSNDGKQPQQENTGENANGQNSGESGNQSGSQEQQANDQNGSESGGGNSGTPQENKPNESGGGDQSSSGAAAEQQPKDGASGNKEPSGGTGSGEQEPGEKQSGGSDSQENSGGGSDSQQQKEAGGSDSQGGQPQGGTKPEENKQQGGSGEEKPDGGGGMGQNDKSGAGEKSDGGGGSPHSQAEEEKQQGKEKSGGGQQGGGEKQEDGGKSPGNSNKDSDSQGGSSGDRKGGGKQGGGQSSQQPGQDSAGSGSSGDQGDGAAQDPGTGQSGNKAGGDQIANSPTGQSGEQAGEGSNTGEGEGGQPNENQPNSGEPKSGDPSSSGEKPGGGTPQDGTNPSQESAGERPSDATGDGRGTLPTGGGKPADNHPSETKLPDLEPGSDEANLDYARKATDLTLEYLKNQKGEPDPELLDKLGWSKDDLNQFVQRWERMKRSAATDDSPDAARKLDDSLRSLGLRPPQDKLRSGEAGGNRLTGQRDAASRSRPPKEYAEQYRAFSKFVKPSSE